MLANHERSDIDPEISVSADQNSELGPFMRRVFVVLMARELVAASVDLTNTTEVTLCLVSARFHAPLITELQEAACDAAREIISGPTSKA